MDGHLRSVQFLRGAASRASFCLPAFYNFLAASNPDEYTTKDDELSRLSRAYSKFSDLNTITLVCRKIFEHSKLPLSGMNFAKTSDRDLQKHARYWSEHSQKSEDQAFAALTFLRQLFRDCSKTDSELLKKSTQLQKRIGLLKQHADRTAAHLSLERHELTLWDVAHVTATVVIIGAIVRSFDDPTNPERYFTNVDANSRFAAARLFPGAVIPRLFASRDIEELARACWTRNQEHGLRWLMEELPQSIGWPG